MTRIFILTAEPSNFVPISFEKEAEALGHEAIIVDITRTVLTERTTKGEARSSIMFYPQPPEPKEGEEPKEVKPIPIDAPCVVISRLNEYGLEYKLGVFGRLRDHGAVMLNTPESMALCNDKLSSQVVLNSAGFRTPYSVAIGSVDLLEGTIEQVEADKMLNFPMIIKTLRGTHGIGVMKVDSRSSLKSVAQAVMADGQEVMLQEFIEHKESARLIMLGNKMLAANKRKQPKEKDEFRTNSHLGSETEKYEPPEAELEMGKKIVELFGCRFCAIDYIINGDELIVLEVNGSPGLEAIQKDWEGERNLPKMVVEFCATIDCGDKCPDPMVEPEKIKSAPEPTDDIEEPAEPELKAAEPEPEAKDKDEKEIEPEAEKELNKAPEKTSPLTDVEPLTIVRLDPKPIDARVDTGAKYCSLHADDVEEANGWVKFKRGGITYKVPYARGIKIRNALGKHHRPIVELDVEVRGKRYSKVEFTVTSRTDMKYEALIGRNLLELLGLPVIVYNTDGTVAKATEDPTDTSASGGAEEE